MYTKKTMKKKEFFLFFEPFILYIVLFLPVTEIFSSSASVQNEAGNYFTTFLNSPLLMIAYIITATAQILLILWIFHLKTGENIPSAYGIVKLNISAVIKAFFYSVILIVISNLLVFFLIKIDFFTAPAHIATVKKYIPLYLAVSIATGYREELFFRSYMINALEKTAEKPQAAVFISSALFAISHINQGFSGILIAFLLGVFLSVMLLRHKNIHINAIAHSFYNFFIFLIA